MSSSLLDLYSDYLISSFGQTSATGLSRLTCKALGFLDTYLVFSPPPQRTGFVVCLGGPAPVFYSRAAARSTVHCRRA